MQLVGQPWETSRTLLLYCSQRCVGTVPRSLVLVGSADPAVSGTWFFNDLFTDTWHCPFRNHIL